MDAATYLLLSLVIYTTIRKRLPMYIALATTAAGSASTSAPTVSSVALPAVTQ